MQPDSLIPVCTNAQLPEDRVRAMVTSEAERQDVDAKLVLAIAQHESGFGAQTNSPAGARGIMQLIPATAERYGVSDICDAEQNIRGGVRFLKDLSALFDGNVMLIAAAYNAGENRVIAEGGIPAIAETVNYTAKVTNTYFGFQNIVANARNKPARQPKTEAASVFSLSAERNDPVPINSTKGAPPANNWLGGSVLYVQ
ncbi:lytic transglycosylase domain-containing protein [Agrobacterium tumefaciens]|uniref:lytic transglycosylase domain-containing protein n=1 Tax=Agrobacterium tumefaciens TaxID=358 RepID=UPI001F2815FC